MAVLGNSNYLKYREHIPDCNKTISVWKYMQNNHQKHIYVKETINEIDEKLTNETLPRKIKKSAVCVCVSILKLNENILYSTTVQQQKLLTF